jgi:CheY-like chemotaxis protein
MGLFETVTSLFGDGKRFDGNDQNGKPAEPKRKPTVLVIDDDANFLQMIRSLLGGAGYGVLTSSTGPEGIDMLRYDPRDVAVVVLDFKMPQHDGAETLKHLRKLKSPVKVIGISGITANKLPKSFQNGVERLVAKPFEPGELLQTIESLLGGNSTAESVTTVSV